MGKLKVKVNGVWVEAVPGSPGPTGPTGPSGVAGPSGPTGPGPGNAESVNVVATSSTAQTIPDPATYSLNRITLTANCTLTFPTASAGKSFTLLLVQDGTGSRTVTWPTITWMGTLAAAPALSTAAGKSDIFSFICFDGTTWVGNYGGGS